MAIKDSRSTISDEGKPGDFQIRKVGKLTIHMIPQVLVELNKEVLKRPDALQAIADGPGGGAGDWWRKLASLAAHYNILMDDTYTAADLEKIAAIVLERMRRS